MRFDLTGADDRELPLILGLMPVLPKHAIDPDTFEETTFAPPVGSGPYIVSEVEAGRQRHVQAQSRTIGAATLPINRGFWNFDEVRFDFYRDGNSHFEAFKKGLYDVRAETRSRPLGDRLRRSRPCATAASSRKASRPACRKASPAFVFNTRRADLRRHPRARGDRPAVRLRMDQPQFLLRPLPAHARAISRAPSCPPRGRPADATRTRRCWRLSRRGARRHPGRHLAAAESDGSGRDRDTLQARARAAVEPPATSSTAPSCVDAQDRRAVHLRNPGHHPGPGAARARLRPRPQARRHHRARARGRCRAVRPAASSPTITT